MLADDTDVDLRALFVDGAGRKAGLMSPGTYTFDTTGPSDTTGPNDTTGPGDTTGDTTGTVPEPAILAMFGAALALGARRLRSRR